MTISKTEAAAARTQEARQMPDAILYERLAFLVAAKKRVEEELKPVEKEAKLRQMDAIDAGSRSDRTALTINDEKVGELAVSWSKPRIEPVPGLEDELAGFLKTFGLTEEQPVRDWRDSFTTVGGAVFHKATGEAAECLYEVGRRPSTQRVTGCEPEDVKAAIGRAGALGWSLRELTERADGFDIEEAESA